MRWIKGEDPGEYWLKTPLQNFCIFHKSLFTRKYTIMIQRKRKKPRFLEEYSLTTAKEIVSHIIKLEKLTNPRRS